MPPALATLLCTIFILLLFYSNSKKTRGVSPGLWVPVIWIAIMASRPIGTWLYGGADTLNFHSYEDGSPIDRNVSLLLMFLGFAILAKRRVQWGVVLKENQWLVIFYLYLLVSVLWSDYTFVAFKRWIRDAATVVMVLVILTEEDPAEGLRQVFLRCAYLLIPLSILTMKYYINIGRTYDPWTGTPCLCGVTVGKNQLGRLAMISALFLIWSLNLQKDSSWFKRVKDRWFDAAVLGLCIMILVQANSATSLFCFGLATAALFVTQLSWIKASPSRLLCLGSLVIALSVLFLSVPDLRGIVTGALHRNVNLTERTDVWEGCIGLGTNPLIGTGFDSVWLTPAAIKLGNRLQVEEAHNGYLEMYLNTGLIGICLLLPVLVVAGKNAVRHVTGNSAMGPLYASLFLVGVIYNYTEAAFDNGNLVGFVLWIVAVQYQTATEPVAIETSGESNRCAPGPASSFAMLLRKD
jgi:exopolysaccharide production protein ExoQ